MLDDLIVEAEKIKYGDWDSPLKGLFRAKAVRYVENNYGPEYANVISNAMRMGVVRANQRSWNQSQHEVKMTGVIDALNQLKSEEKLEAPSHEVSNKKTASGTTYHVQGESIQIGDGNTLNKNLTVTNIIEALEKEIKLLPESRDKKTILDSLKLLTSNETFGNVMGASVGALLGNIIK